MNGFLPADWPAPPGVRAGTTLRDGPGVSAPPFDRFNLGERCGDDAAAVAANRAALRRLLDLPGEPHWLHQVHGVGVVRVDGLDDRGGWTAGPAGEVRSPPWRLPQGRDMASGSACGSRHGGDPTQTGSEPSEADAAVTSNPGVVLAILSADCLPLLLAADDGSEIGAAHAGWRGLACGIIEATVAAMRTPPAALRAWLGPAAGPSAYEVGDEVRAAFVDVHAAAADAFRPTRPGHWRCDLYALARQRLQQLGIGDIHGGDLCTIGDRARFYSHRRDQRTGRLASLIWRCG